MLQVVQLQRRFSPELFMDRHVFSLLCLYIVLATAEVTEGPWLMNGAPVPTNGLRVTTLGSGTPDVRKDQVSSGFLIELGTGDKFIWDLGTGCYQNLLATAVPAAQLTKVTVLRERNLV